jgi:hypothetical protein
MGLAEPCLLLTLAFLLRAPLQRINSGTLSKKWNSKTAGYIFLFCLPVFILQLGVILIGPRLIKSSKGSLKKLPWYFVSTAQNSDEIAFCTYPLLRTILLALFVTVLTTYLFFVGRRILKLAINKGLQKRVCTLICSVTSLFPLRVIFLGLSVLSKPEHFAFEALAFLAFLALLCCVGVCIFVLVYYPVKDSLAIGNLQDIEAQRRSVIIDDHDETVSLAANLEESGRISDDSTKRGSISFRTMARDGSSAELSLFSPSRDAAAPPGPLLGGWPMLKV